MTSRRSVVILQEYIPGYRVPFFGELVSQAADVDIEVRVGHGTPHSDQAARRDQSEFSSGFLLDQREFRVLGRRLVVRRIPKTVRSADLLILEQARRNVDAYRLFLPRWLRRPRRIALWGHGRDYTRQSTAADRRLFRALTHRAEWFFGYTSASVDHVVREGFDPRRTTEVRNSTDTQALSRRMQELSTSDLDEFARRHDLRGRTALYLGALDESKLIPLLLESAGLAHDADPSFRLLVAGDGPLRRSVEEKGAECAYICYLGQTEGYSKAIALHHAQVLAIPGRVGLIAVDSIAAERPIVTTDFPFHAPEYEYLGPTTRIESARDAQSFAEALVSILSNAEGLESLRSNLRAMQADFGVETMARNFLVGIQAVLESDG